MGELRGFRRLCEHEARGGHRCWERRRRRPARCADVRAEEERAPDGLVTAERVDLHLDDAACDSEWVCVVGSPASVREAFADGILCAQTSRCTRSSLRRMQEEERRVLSRRRRCRRLRRRHSSLGEEGFRDEEEGDGEGRSAEEWGIGGLVYCLENYAFLSRHVVTFARSQGRERDWCLARHELRKEKLSAVIAPPCPKPCSLRMPFFPASPSRSSVPVLNSACPWASSAEDLAALYTSPHTSAVTTRTTTLTGFPDDPKQHQVSLGHPPSARSSPARPGHLL